MLKEKRQEMVKNVILKMADKFLTESKTDSSSFNFAISGNDFDAASP